MLTADWRNYVKCQGGLRERAYRYGPQLAQFSALHEKYFLIMVVLEMPKIFLCK